MVKGKEFSNQFEGNAYVSSMVGFVPQIIMLGLKGAGEAQLKALVNDMKKNARLAADAQGGAYQKAYEALLNN